MKSIGYIQLFSLLFVLIAEHAYSQNVTIDDTYTAQQLVENVLINNPCATVSNVTISGDPFSGAQQSYGYFSNGGGTFPFANGVILCTARASRAAGPNTNLIDEGQNAWQGDIDLEQALNITNTYNATTLEFDFTPQNSNFRFNYIFASEEYQGTAPCRYSDGFAFLLKEVGSSAAYQNLAIIPGTTTPVLVTSVHPAIPGSCAAANESYFGGYNNSGAPINFNGQTVVMTAQATVIPGRNYHIKLVIADHENVRYDSAIFLGGGSFNLGIDLGPDRLVATNNPVCEGNPITLNATQSGSNSYQWFLNGAAMSGETNPTLTISNSVSGTYSVTITTSTGSCSSSGSCILEFVPKPVLVASTLLGCDDNLDGSARFNLTKINALVTNNNSSYGTVQYFESIIDAQQYALNLAIPSPNNYESIPKTIYAAVQTNFGCIAVVPVVLQVSGAMVPQNLSYASCDLDGTPDGFFGFTLAAIDSLLLNGLPAGLVVNYYASMADAQAEQNQLSAVFTNTIIDEQTIYAKITNGPDCYGISSILIQVNRNQPANFEDETLYLCPLESLNLRVDPTFNAYNWSTGAATSQISITEANDYTVTVSDVNGCLATKKFVVVASSAPTITSINVDHFQTNGGTVTVLVSGSGNYQYSLNGSNFQISPIFNDVAPNEYTFIAYDTHGCGQDTETVYVLDYPRFFTPNGDGFNDFWQIDQLKFVSKAQLRIFDRFGKLLKEFNEASTGWDGTYLGLPLPADDYWFTVQFEKLKNISGHMSLKR
ncbi:MAG: T9SS type B sorting domain-containing protein [Flavobacterium sp.]|nr:T9SS type B sorting domain-containing protein [Flavobacterium sp.]